MTNQDFLLVGVGGQGVLTASDIVAEVGMALGLDVKKSEVHGFSQRGGSVDSHVRWGKRVAAPMGEKGRIDYLLAFELMESARWIEFLKPGGVVIVNRQKILPLSATAGDAVYPDDARIAAALRAVTDQIVYVEGLRVAQSLGNKHLANKAQIFENAFAASFPTVPARADLLTGRYTFTYLDWGPLPQNEITLAQLLSKAGYLTFGVADTPFFIRNGYGYDRGFQDFVWIRGQRDGPEKEDVLRQRRAERDYFAPATFQTAIEWLERHPREQFFLYVDTWDPHEPWDPPDYYVRLYDPNYAGEQVGPCYWEWFAPARRE